LPALKAYSSNSSEHQPFAARWSPALGIDERGQLEGFEIDGPAVPRGAYIEQMPGSKPTIKQNVSRTKVRRVN
jgi:hypothetical protein